MLGTKLQIGCYSSVSSVFASHASDPEIEPSCQNILLWKIYSPILLIQEELVVSFWEKNGHEILVNCLWEACPGTVLVKKLTVPT